jgi:ATP synthase protein I
MFSGLSTGTQRVALAQAGLAPIAALVGTTFAGVGAGLALLYGVLSSLAVSLVLVWHEQQSMRHPEWDQHRLFKLFIVAGVERLLVLLVLLAVGLGVLKLAPLPMISGLLLAQLAWLAVVINRN